MNRWINWLINSGKPTPDPVRSDGDVRVEGAKVIYSPRKGFRETIIDLTQLQYIYLYTTADSQTIVLNDYHQHLIPYSTNGFEIFFRHLSVQFSLNEEKFFETLAGKKAVKMELWRANSPDNCKVIDASGQTTNLQKQLSEGFWVSASPKQWISWDMTSDALAKLSCVYQTTNEYGLIEIRFRHPVQLGNLVLDDFRYYLPHVRRDVPLDSFYTNLRIQGNGDQNYFLAKNALREIMGEPVEGYERNDQNACHWLFNGLKFSLIYWYDGQSSYESGYAYLGVQNERTYPNYMTDPAYERDGILSKCLVSQHDFHIGSDFRRSQYFKKTPQFVAQKLIDIGHKFIIWLDELHRKVGFANEDYAMIFPVEAVTKFNLQNVLPGRSGGGSYLSATLSEGGQQSVLVGDCYAFDSYLDQLAELVPIPVIELTPYEE